MVPLVGAGEAEPVLIAGHEPVLNPPTDWPVFWGKLNQYSDWDLEYFDNDVASWLSVKSDLEIVRDYPEPNKVKLTLVFDASHAANYRLTFAINRAVKQYVTHISEYCYELNYDNFSLVWDWSDAVGIPGVVFTHGVLNDVFWFRMRRDNVPLGAHVEIDPTLIASYDETNQSDAYELTDEHPSDVANEESAAGQSFQTGGASLVLTNAVFYLKKTGTPTAPLTAKLYAHSGVYGVSSEPTGAALATSTTYYASSLTTSYQLINFTFTGANQYLLAIGTNYCIAVVVDDFSVSGANYVNVGLDDTAPGHAGNAFSYDDGSWDNNALNDVIFYVYGTPHPPVVDSLAGDTLFTQNEEGWLNATVSDAGLVADLATVTLGITLNGNETVSLRWTQTTGLFSEVSDPSGVCTFNTTTSIRVNIDTDTDQLCFRFMFTGGTEGACDVVVTAVDDGALTDVETFLAAFTYTTISWGPIAAIIDAAFSLFGITGYMTQITTFINDISAQFVDSLVGLATLINLQFQVIWNVFTWWTGWATRMITAALAFGAALQMILNGTHPLIAGGVDMWNYFDFASAGQSVYDVAPIFLILYWINSMGQRARTQGALSVLVSDLQNFANVFAFFMTAFGTVIGFIEGKISWLIQALP